MPGHCDCTERGAEVRLEALAFVLALGCSRGLGFGVLGCSRTSESH